MGAELGSLRELGEAEEFISRFENTLPPGYENISTETVGFPALLSEALSVFSEEGGTVLSFFLFTVGLTLLMALASFVSGRLSRAAECAVMIISGAAVFSAIYPITAGICETMGGVLNFCTAFMPILTAVIAYGGGSASATAGAAGANMTLGIMGAFVLPLLEKCATLVFALGLVGGTLGDGGTAGLAKRVKSFFMWLVGLATTLLLSSLALQSVIASSSDNAAMRAAKYAASGAIPIVGGSVSSAMGALVTGVSYIKNVIGIGGVTVMLLTVLSPLVSLLLYRLILALGEGILDFVGVSFGVRIFSSFKAAIDVLLAVFVLSVTVLIIETAILMKSGVSG